jgi:periplasmic glucans biosynthesis protein
MTIALPRRPSRRTMLAGLVAAAAVPAARAADAPSSLGPPKPFNFERLAALAKTLAARPYQPPVIREAGILDRIDYDAFQEIHFRRDQALWRDQPRAYPVELFHLGRFFKAPVRIYQVSGDQAREVLYTPSLFDFGKAEFARGLPMDLGFAGFRVMHPNGTNDWLAFLGASYFRSSGELDQYGLSARAVAIDTAMPVPEEFPRFTRFWIEQPVPGTERIVIFALLEGPSLAGAFRIEAGEDHRVVLDIDAVLFTRKDIGRLGLAPLSSMFWYGKHNRTQGTDWRPELHDSDGLAIWTGTGERLWRPLNDPSATRVSAFADVNPRGFGLLQRDRSFADYQDDSVFYERRPSVWIEPLGHWGAGAVQLIELPTEDETNDNIVACWVPREPIRAGAEHRFGYRLHWLAEEPYPPVVGHVIATRTGVGGVPGQKRPPGRRKFVIDFAGGTLAQFVRESGVEPVVTASAGRIVEPYALPIVGTGHWRCVFDLDSEATDPIELRCYLRRAGNALTETWLYQYLPV